MFWFLLICVGFILIVISFFNENLLLTQVGIILLSIGIFYGFNFLRIFSYLVDTFTTFLSSYDLTTFFDPS